ncbi:MAG: tRNA uridine-5-carboxymethylaminomethyl(34) synthesis GTPase MnmE [Clostridiales bacterium]|nr:tRNA uridine-5-carboxymethylaminomethyl(34) synthesis GTPase MnmE [Clostridiales bacterium]
MRMEDTIAAIATAYGEGGIGIVRISGNRSKEILDKLFKPAKNQDRKSIVNRQLTYGYIVSPEDNKIIDEVLVVFMKAPSTYTREDVVEIFCHGSTVSLNKTLSLVLDSGARLAEAGEFTKRAFLNGRIDLSQAEAVIDVIKAKTEKSFELAIDQMEGHLSQRVKELRDGLMDLLVRIAVNIDYSEEDIEELSYEETLTSLSSIGDKIEKLLSTADTGRMIREGLRVTIVGRPNVGKSSLMNALLRESRAIVTDIPGTTRDTIEEVLNLRGIPVYLTDTAGIHSTEDEIEKIGIERSKLAFNRADLIIFMVDGSLPLREEDYLIADQIGDRKVIVILNKSDLGKSVTEKQIKELLDNAIIIDAAVIHDKGIKELEDSILNLVYGGKVSQEHSDMVTNIRHKDLLEKAKNSIGDAKKMALNNQPMDLIEIDIRQAWEYLGEIIGETVTEDIIDQVFSRFCLGK